MSEDGSLFGESESLLIAVSNILRHKLNKDQSMGK